MNGKRLGKLAGASVLMCIAMFVAQPSAAFDLSGKRVQAIVPFAEGGGTDVYARALLPLMQQHLPGKPTINILNQPGGGSITGANKFEQSAAPDGLTILVSSTSTILNAVFDDPRVQYNPAEWVPIITSPLGGVIYVSPKTGVGKPEDIKNLIGQKLVFGANTPRGADVTRLLMFDMLGFDLNVVFGISASGARQAFERGEFNIAYENPAAYVKQVVPMVEAGTAVPIFSYGYLEDDGTLVRDRTFPDLPHFGEAYKAIHGKDPSGPAYDALRTLFNAQVMASKAIVLPKGTSEEIVGAYRNAVAKALEAPEFQTVKEQVVGDYPQSLGTEAVRVLVNSTVMKPEAKAWLMSWLEEKYAVKR